MWRQSAAGVLGIVLRLTFVLTVLFAQLAAPTGSSLARGPENETFIEALAGFKKLEIRSGINSSPDSRLVAVVYNELPDRVDNTQSFAFSDTGVSLTEGSGRRRIAVLGRSGKRVVEIGNGFSAWGPAWSPDGRSLAFYSDEGGEAGLWILDVSRLTRRRVGSVIVRPFFTTDRPKWVDDGRRILTKALPKGMSLTSANINAPTNAERTSAKVAGSATTFPKVSILSSDSMAQSELSALEGLAAYRSSLVIVDIGTGGTMVLVNDALIAGYDISPTFEFAAYSIKRGRYENTMSSGFELHTIRLRDGLDVRRVEQSEIGDDGSSFTWSPNGQRLAYPVNDPRRGNGLATIDLEGAQSFIPVAAEDNSRRGFGGNSRGISSSQPLWSADSKGIYAIVDSRICYFDPSTKTIKTMLSLDTAKIDKLSTTLSGANSPLLVFSTTADGTFEARSIELGTDKARLLFRRSQGYVYGTSATASRDGGLMFIAEDAFSPPDIWRGSLGKNATVQLSHLNPVLTRNISGEVRTLNWLDGRGESRSGVLQLPILPKGSRPPVVVFVYGGSRGGENARRYGAGWGNTPFLNMSVFLSQGYAVFYPGSSYRQGRAADDVTDDVLTGVRKLTDLGLVDSNRMFLRGQSFGSFNVWNIMVRSTMFRAAITSANVTNPDLVASYLLMDGSGSSRTGLYEVGQYNMGGTPWTRREDYIAGSSIYRLDKITTPLLMIQGEDDWTMTAADAMYVGLRRLGKPVEYRRYQSEGHGLQIKGNLIDSWIRQLDFLAENAPHQALDRP